MAAITHTTACWDTPELAPSATALPKGPSSLPTPNLRHNRILELTLILFAIYYGGVLHFAYRLIFDLPITPPTITIEIFLANLWRKVAALGILAYIFALGSGRSAPHLPAPGADSPTPSANTRHAFELALVLLVGLGIHILSSTWSLMELGPFPTSPNPASYTLGAQLAGILQHCGSLALLTYVLYRSGRSYHALGVRWSRTEIEPTAILFAAVLLIYMISASIIPWCVQALVHHPVPEYQFAKLTLSAPVILAELVYLILNGFCEELIVRAYLITALRRLTNSNLFPVLCSVGLQLSYHFYQGVPMALSHAPAFLLLSVYYLRTKRALPIILVHILFDLLNTLKIQF